MELTKYEIARIIGARSLQISQGAPPLIAIAIVKKLMDPVDIAIKEFEAGKIPINVERPQ
ncbi:MAG: DNA-directed RNA polymerase subunit K [Candidatus Nanoarchaeia archaeon]